MAWPANEWGVADASPDKETILRPYRGLALTSTVVLKVLRAAETYSSMRDVRVSSVVSAFRGGWIPPSIAEDAEKERLTAEERLHRDVAFANGLADILYGLDRAKKLTVSPRSRWAANILLDQLGPFRRATDDPRDPPDPVDAFLDACDHERIGEIIDARDITWTPARLADHRVSFGDGPRMGRLEAAKLLATVTTDTLYVLVEEGLEDPKRRRGIDSAWLANALGLQEAEHGLLESLLEEAVHQGELTLVEDGGPRRWKLGGPDTKRGLGRMLDHFRWADRREWRPFTERRRRVDLAKALGIGKGDVTSQVAVLMAYGFLEEEDDRLHADKALKLVLSILLEEIGTNETTVRRVVEILGDRLRPSYATVKRERPSAKVALASAPEKLDEETLWVIADDLLPEWLEEAGPDGKRVEAGGRERAPYRGNSRPYARAPYRTRVRLTADAYTFLETCSVCAKPWGEQELVSRILGEWWRDTSLTTAIIHASCAPATLFSSRRAGRLIEAGCIKCKGELEPSDPGPVRARELKNPDLGAYLDGWSSVRHRLERYLDEVEGGRSSKIVADKVADIRARLLRVHDADLRKEEVIDKVIEECHALSKLLVDRPGTGTLAYEPSRGVPFTLHSRELRDAVWDVDRERPRVVRLRFAGGLVHPRCA